MNEHPVNYEYWQLATRLEQAARYFPYPATPDIAQEVTTKLANRQTRKRLYPRQLAWTAAAVFILIAILLAVPPVRAAILEVLRLGAVRIFLVEPTRTATAPVPTVSSGAPPTATPRPSPTPVASILELAGETTLAEARTEVDFPIRLPTEPTNLGPPDRVFLQNLNGPLIVLVWLDSDQPEQVQLSLHLLGPGTFAGKGVPEVLQETTVNGQRALWLEGPHFLQLRNGNYDMRRLVDGHVLVWTEGEVTYRLETSLPFAEAVRIAESLE